MQPAASLKNLGSWEGLGHSDWPELPMEYSGQRASSRAGWWAGKGWHWLISMPGMTGVGERNGPVSGLFQNSTPQNLKPGHKLGRRAID